MTSRNLPEDQDPDRLDVALREPTYVEAFLDRARHALDAGKLPLKAAVLADHFRLLLLAVQFRTVESVSTVAAYQHVRLPTVAAGAPGAGLDALEIELWQRHYPVYAVSATDRMFVTRTAYRLRIWLPPLVRAEVLAAVAGSRCQDSHNGQDDVHGDVPRWLKHAAMHVREDGVLLQYANDAAALRTADPLAPAPWHVERALRWAADRLANWRAGEDATGYRDAQRFVRGPWIAALYQYLVQVAPHELVVAIEQGNADPNALLGSAVGRANVSRSRPLTPLERLTDELAEATGEAVGADAANEEKNGTNRSGAQGRRRRNDRRTKVLTATQLAREQEWLA